MPAPGYSRNVDTHANRIPLFFSVRDLATLMIPSFAFLVILRLRQVFSRQETGVGDIEWHMVGERTGLLKLYCILSQALISTSKPILAMEMIVSTLSDLSVKHPALSRLSITHTGSVSCQYLTQDLEVNDIMGSYSIFLNRIYGAYKMLLGNAAEIRVKETFGPIIENAEFIMQKRPQIVSSLFGGILSNKASTGTIIDEILMGGLKRGSSALLIGPPNSLRDIFSSSFALQGLLGGEECLYVTSLKSPQEIRQRFSPFVDDALTQLHIVDCHSFLTDEIPKISFLEKENVTQCPNFELADHAVSEVLNKKGARRGRAIIDILPTWLILSRSRGMTSIVVAISKMIAELDKRGFVSVIILNFSTLEEQEELILAELVTTKIHLINRGENLEITIPKGIPQGSRTYIFSVNDWIDRSIHRLLSPARKTSEFQRTSLSQHLVSASSSRGKIEDVLCES